MSTGSRQDPICYEFSEGLSGLPVAGSHKGNKMVIPMSSMVNPEHSTRVAGVVCEGPLPRGTRGLLIFYGFLWISIDFCRFSSIFTN